MSQVCDRWIYSACLCFGLDLDEQRASNFRYSYSVYHVEYSRNLLFRLGGQMDRSSPSSSPGQRTALPRPSDAARTMTALVVLRDQVVGPILAGVRVPRRAAADRVDHRRP